MFFCFQTKTFLFSFNWLVKRLLLLLIYAVNPILRLPRQNEATWASFHRRVSAMTFDYTQLFLEPVYNFLEAKAKSVGSSVGYLFPSLITATAFLLTNSEVHFSVDPISSHSTYTLCPLAIQEHENHLRLKLFWQRFVKLSASRRRPLLAQPPLLD